MSNLDGGNYRVTVTRSGQLNFRYTFGGQTFDSNPEAALFNVDAMSNGPGDGGRMTYTASATLTVDNPVMAGSLIQYNSQFQFSASANPSQLLNSIVLDTPAAAAATTATADSGQTTFAFKSDALAFNGSIDHANFDISSLTPTLMQVPSTSPLAYIGSGGGDQFGFDPLVILEEVPEPGTFAMLAGAFAIGLAVLRMRSSRAA